jgi:hypothetical protein
MIFFPVVDVYELFIQLTRIESVSREFESDDMVHFLISKFFLSILESSTDHYR